MILSGAITDFAISPDGNSLYLLDGAAGIVRVYDIASLALQRTFVVSGSGTSISLSPDGRQVWITHNSTPTGVTWYTGTIANGFVSSGQITMLSAPARVYFSPTGNFAAITNAGGWVDIVR
jgi:DNA-binding beta-propeller fold protein YncE